MKKEAKKHSRKPHNPSAKTSASKRKTAGESQVEKTLVSNFVALQKIFTNIAVKFDNLSEQISKLLELFEISAKAMAEKNLEVIEKTKDEEILKKVNTLIEQNRIIAKGVTMLHEAPREEIFTEQEEPSKLPIPYPGQNLQTSATERKFKQLQEY